MGLALTQTSCCCRQRLLRWWGSCRCHLLRNGPGRRTAPWASWAPPPRGLPSRPESPHSALLRGCRWESRRKDRKPPGRRKKCRNNFKLITKPGFLFLFANRIFWPSRRFHKSSRLPITTYCVWCFFCSILGAFMTLSVCSGRELYCFPNMILTGISWWENNQIEH